jgi:hypothetical protein
VSVVSSENPSPSDSHPFASPSSILYSLLVMCIYKTRAWVVLYDSTLLVDVGHATSTRFATYHLPSMSRRQPAPGAVPAPEEETVSASGDAEEMEEVEDDQEGYSARLPLRHPVLR